MPPDDERENETLLLAKKKKLAERRAARRSHVAFSAVKELRRRDEDEASRWTAATAAAATTTPLQEYRARDLLATEHIPSVPESRALEGSPSVSSRRATTEPRSEAPAVENADENARIASVPDARKFQDAPYSRPRPSSEKQRPKFEDVGKSLIPTVPDSLKLEDAPYASPPASDDKARD